jgi:hypothetical protein
MKFIYAAILAGLMAGCATVPSEYNQGCRDGIRSLEGQIKNGGFRGYDHPENIDPFCDALDKEHVAAQKIREGGRR